MYELPPLRSLVRDPLVLIYQMPKAGSQTVEATLQEAALPWRMARLHFLSAEPARMLVYGLNDPANTELWKANARYQLELRELLCQALRARRWRRLFRRRLPKLHVITAVRDPIAVCLSSTFENYSESLGKDEARALDYCRYVLTSPETLPSVWNWFDAELKPWLGINVYKREFPRERGYTIYENWFARVLVYRFEALPALPNILQEFFKWPVPQVVNRNIGDRKDYGSLYRAVQDKFHLPSNLVQAACDCKMMRHFYSAEERRRFQARWSEPREPAAAGSRLAAA